MVRPFLLTRASIGLAAAAVEQAVLLPGRTIRYTAALPVRVAGGAVRSYMQAGQTVTALAIRGDRVIDAVTPTRSGTPSWATFDEDEPPQVERRRGGRR